jgi:hypothetical protein
MHLVTLSGFMPHLVRITNSQRWKLDRMAAEMEISNYWEEPIELLSEQVGIGNAMNEKLMDIAGSEGKSILVYNLRRALLLTGEILILLRNGYPDGAMSRVRTLSELVVCTFFITNILAQKIELNIAEQYIEHEWVRRRQFLKGELEIIKGIEKSSGTSSAITSKRKLIEKEITEATAAIKEAKKKYGSDFSIPEYGWAYSAVRKYKKNKGDTINEDFRVDLTALRDVIGMGNTISRVFALGNQASHAGAFPSLPVLPMPVQKRFIWTGSIEIGLFYPLADTSYILMEISRVISANIHDEEVNKMASQMKELHQKIVNSGSKAEEVAFKMLKGSMKEFSELTYLA